MSMLLNRFVANRWLNKLKNDRKLEVELFGSEQPGLIIKNIKNS